MRANRMLERAIEVDGKINPDFFHRKTWQVVHNPASSDTDLDIMWGLAELYSEIEEGD